MREITVQLEKEKEMELETTGDFHTEKEMRDELKLAESPGKKPSYVQSVCVYIYISSILKYRLGSE